MPIRVLVADDEPAVLAFLSEIVRSGEEMDLVAAAPDAARAVDLARRHRPDVAVLDVNMPEGGGARATREIKVFAPETRVVALSASDDRDAVLEMLRSGAAGYVVKGATVKEILEGIRGAARGEAPLSSAVALNVVSELTGRLEQEAGEVERREEVVRRIRGVMEGHRLTVVFQPIYDLEQERMVGAEALSRFEAEPRRTPDVWFAEAASVGLGVDLEMWAVKTALQHLRSLPAAAYLSLNLSPDAARSGTLADVVAPGAVERTVVEITEHAPVLDYDALAEALQGFRSGGGRVAIDDAGAGFASLRHIVSLAPDIIKLDISLTRDVHLDQTRRALAAALISFARETGKVIVAEGVERAEELETLRELGAAQAQGFHLARPAPPESLQSLWKLPPPEERSSGAGG
jgi:EAL domain-containing protein (putative c-di-GMP-specific phosphodiesterase class I)/DNA-binding NarL/FixJ family response regulator